LHPTFPRCKVYYSKKSPKKNRLFSKDLLSLRVFKRLISA